MPNLSPLNTTGNDGHTMHTKGNEALINFNINCSSDKLVSTQAAILSILFTHMTSETFKTASSLD